MTKKKSTKQPDKTEFEKRLEAELAQNNGSETEVAAELEDGEPVEVLDVASPKLEALTKERDELKDQMLRSRAEFENFRRRVARESELTRLRATEKLIMELLPVMDHLELALQHANDDSGGFAEGVEMVRKQLLDVLLNHKVEPIAAVGEPFNPEFHEALMRQPADVPEDHVAQEFQKGYMLGEHVLRPAKVVVSAGNADMETE